MVCLTCSAQRASQQENLLLSIARMAPDKDGLAGVQAVESKALKMKDAHAIRRADALVLQLKSGKTKTFRNRPECRDQDQEAKCQMYSLVVHASSRHVFVIAKICYESVEYLLVDDETGAEAILSGFPVFSPSGQRVLVLLMDDERIGFGIQIWHRRGPGFALEWSGTPRFGGTYSSYELIGWSKENTIELSAEIGFDSPQPNLKKFFALSYSKPGWAITGIR